MPEKDKVEQFYNQIGQDHAGLAKGLLNFLRAREEKGLRSILEVEAGEKVLDAGCGSGAYTKLLLEKTPDVYACDFAEARLPFVRELLSSDRVFRHDLHEALPLGEFNKILCAGVLEFCAQPILAAKNLSDALVPGGTLYALIPLRNPVGLAYRWYHKRHGFSINLFTREGIEELCGGHLKLQKMIQPNPHIAGVVLQKL